MLHQGCIQLFLPWGFRHNRTLIYGTTWLCVHRGIDTVSVAQSKRDARSGDDSENTDEQANSPLHVLSDAAQKEGDLGVHPAKRMAREDNRGS